MSVRPKRHAGSVLEHRGHPGAARHQCRGGHAVLDQRCRRHQVRPRARQCTGQRPQHRRRHRKRARRPAQHPRLARVGDAGALRAGRHLHALLFTIRPHDLGLAACPPFEFLPLRPDTNWGPSKQGARPHRWRRSSPPSDGVRAPLSSPCSVPRLRSLDPRTTTATTGAVTTKADAAANYVDRSRFDLR